MSSTFGAFIPDKHNRDHGDTLLTQRFSTSLHFEKYFTMVLHVLLFLKPSLPMFSYIIIYLYCNGNLLASHNSCHSPQHDYVVE